MQALPMKISVRERLGAHEHGPQRLRGPPLFCSKRGSRPWPIPLLARAGRENTEHNEPAALKPSQGHVPVLQKVDQAMNNIVEALFPSRHALPPPPKSSGFMDDMSTDLLADLRDLADQAALENQQWAQQLAMADLRHRQLQRELAIARQRQELTRASLAGLRQLLSRARVIAHHSYMQQFAERVYYCGRQEEPLATKEFWEVHRATTEQLKSVERQLSGTMDRIVALLTKSDSMGPDHSPLTAMDEEDMMHKE